MLRHQVRVLRNILSNPVLLYSTSLPSNEQTVKPVFKRLLDEFKTAKPVILKLKKYDVMNLNFSEWKSRIDAMKETGFSDIECFQMISRYPLILEIPLLKFKGTLFQWQTSDLGAQNVMSLLLTQPGLLEVDAADIRNRIPQLRVIFGSSNSMLMLLNNSPNVMCDNWPTVLMKTEYFLKERRFTAGEIAQTGAMSKSMDFIKFRFDLLEKCGVYKQSNVPIHKKNKYDTSRHINPSLKKILMTDVKDFVKIACVSEEEYSFYRDIFMAEEEEEDDDDDDEDDD